MIICDHSAVEEENGCWSIKMGRKICGALGLFPGQTLFGAAERGPDRLFLSPLRLNPHVSSFRIFLEDVRGSLAEVTGLFSDKNVNILSAGAFGFGNIWVSEFLADFRGVDASPEDISAGIEGMGGFVTSREITELFPRAFEMSSTYELRENGGEGDLVLTGEAGASTPRGGSYAVIKAWPRLQALFVDFYPSEGKLVRVSAKLSDVPGSLRKLADLLGAQVDLNAIDALHHDEASGEWNAYGVLVIGGLGDLRGRASGIGEILELEVEPLGWEG